MGNETPEQNVNNSGFPLQIGVIHRLRNALDLTLDFRYLEHEYPWASPSSGHHGFIDIVALRNDTWIANRSREIFLLIECKKRSQNQKSWIFMAEKGIPHSGITTCRTAPCNETRNSAVCDFFIRGGIDRYEYAITPGEKHFNMDREAATIVEATDCFASDNEGRSRQDPTARARVYLPTLVVNAPLFGCYIDASRVNLDVGEADILEVQELDWLMYQKRLTPGSEMISGVLVVKSGKLEKLRYLTVGEAQP